MIQEFKYTQNPEADTPIMFIDKEIGGKDANGEPNIQGNDFLKELLYLSDTLNKKNICVWINSPGGVVTEGQSIYTAILNSKAKVDTYCYGIAASIAGVIFQAGRTRMMADFAKLMYHPAYSEDGKQDKGLEALNHSICTMIAKRTGKTEDEVWAIMNAGRKDDKGTWLDAYYAKDNGFCDEVKESDSVNKNAITSEMTSAIYEKANLIYNRVKNNQTIKTMNYKNLNTTLGLQEDASEASAIVAVTALNKSMEDLQKKYDDLKKKLADCEEEMDAMKKKAKADEDATKAKADEDAKNAKKAEDEAKAKKADEDVKNAVALGKIKNDAEVIKNYTSLYLASPETTKALIDSLPINKAGASFIVNKDGETPTDTQAEQSARKNGIKPGTAQWYNAIKEFELKYKN